ncbi:MAG: ferredoxin:thioredoxin reductase [Candidatus Staskawiczbacteria bacterium]|nr:ferredoxin:thioredoxin reductase [Candidatus Staskawiczbacteria bacterium]
MENFEEIIQPYKKHAEENGFQLNPNEKIVEGIMAGLGKNQEKHGERYCPCRRVTGDKEADKKIICPCIYHKDEIAKDGHCFCNLFVK